MKAKATHSARLSRLFAASTVADKPVTLRATLEEWQLKVPFVIARSSRTHATVVLLEIRVNGRLVGRGECQPNPRFGFSPSDIVAELDGGVDTPKGLIARLDRFSAPARNALDSALLDYAAREAGLCLFDMAGVPRDIQCDAIQSVITVSLGEPEAMARAARSFFDEAPARPIKLKLGADGDASRMQAVRAILPESAVLLVDANEGWHVKQLDDLLTLAARLDIALVEQPLPAGKDAALANYKGLVPLCADEAFTGAEALSDLSLLYDMVNIKLDKLGGLSAALEMRDKLKAANMDYMLGCMLGTSLAMAPAWWLGHDARFVDLDGPILLSNDRQPSMVAAGGRLNCPDKALWGGGLGQN